MSRIIIGGVFILSIVVSGIFLLIACLEAKSWQEFWAWNIVTYIVAYSIVAIITLGFHLLIKYLSSEGDSRGLLALIIGQDGRVSTSKLQVALWTYAVFFSLLVLLFHPNGLDKFTKHGLQAEYLILLGSPAAAAIFAKTSTTSKVASGTLAKPEAEDDPSAVDGVVQAVSNDEGRTDLFDFQYLLFNVFALLYFFWRFLPEPSKGLPNLPETLVALTGVAAAGYATKKGLESNVPVLTGVYPAAAAPGEQVLIRGKNLTISSEEESSVRVSGEELSHTSSGGVPCAYRVGTSTSRRGWHVQRR